MAQGRSTNIISMIKWIRTSRLSIKNSVCEPPQWTFHARLLEGWLALEASHETRLTFENFGLRILKGLPKANSPGQFAFAKRQFKLPWRKAGLLKSAR